jgi:CHAD domain-containing protein
VVQAAITAATVRITVHDAGVRLGDDPEDVHQARVGTRRLRSDLRTFRPLLDPDWVAGLRAEAGWYAGLLGAVRDAEVMAERLERQIARLTPDDAAAVQPLLRKLAEDREAGRAKLLEEMNSARYAEFLDRLVEACRAPALLPEADAPAAAVLPALVRRPWRRLRRAVEALAPEPPDEDLHAVRILAKHTRYAAEAAAPVVGRRARRFAAAIADLQTVLGDHQDAVVAEGWLRDQLTGAGPVEAMVSGQLIGLQRAEAAAHRDAWRQVWRRASDRSLRTWLTTPPDG